LDASAKAQQENLAHATVVTDMPARSHPHLHVPRLVLSSHHRGQGVLNTIAQWVNEFVGSMWVFVAVTTIIVVWLFAGNIVGFDKTPWPLLLTLLNLPQLSIMISLQVSANLAQRTADSRAVADHETLIALHELSKQQLTILEGQNQILDLLKKSAESSA
jgi:low affinity Fe/Cu permease